MGAVLLTAPFAFPQAAAPTGFPLESLKVKGNEEIPTDRILKVAALPIGRPVSKADFDAARNRLLDTGAFEAVGYEYKPSAAKTGYDGTFEVSEVTPLYPYRFEELGAPEADLREMLRKQESIFGDKIPATTQVMNRYSVALAKFLLDKVQVIGDINSDTPGEQMILFRPMGARNNVSEVDFTGNSVLPSEDLRRAIAAVAVGTPYSEPLFRQMLDSAIRTLYEERGRLRVVFSSIKVSKSTENQGVSVMVAIQEGDSYNLGEVTFNGVDGRKATELARIATWRKGEVADFTTIANSLSAIRKSFREEGYLHAATKLDRDLHDAEHTVDLRITVEPGKRYTMGKLTIKGLNINTEPVIRKAWKLQENAPYRESYPDTFLKNIREDGVFEDLDRTAAEVVPNDETGAVDVTLTFVATKPGALKETKGQR
jgi:outer membrane protein assembly factor BamA